MLNNEEKIAPNNIDLVYSYIKQNRNNKNSLYNKEFTEKLVVILEEMKTNNDFKNLDSIYTIIEEILFVLSNVEE